MKQKPRSVGLMKKPRGRKSRAFVPLKEIKIIFICLYLNLNFNNSYFKYLSVIIHLYKGGVVAQW
jgi:hypothetical protein